MQAEKTTRGVGGRRAYREASQRSGGMGRRAARERRGAIFMEIAWMNAEAAGREGDSTMGASEARRWGRWSERRTA